MLRNAWLIPAIPVVSFWLILFFGKRLPRQGAELGVAALLCCFVLSLIVGAQWISRDATVEVRHHAAATAAEGGHAEPAAAEAEAEVEHRRPAVQHTWTWFEMHRQPARDAGGAAGTAATVTGSGPLLKVEIGTLVDGLSVALLLVVSTISLLVHIFSTEYMRDDRRKTHYFASLSLFTAGMFTLVTAPSTLQMILGWELMGLCSFLLIGHWWEEHANSRAALKAFLTTRTGDIGLLVGISMLFFLAGQTFDIGTINGRALAGAMPQTALTVAAIALLAAVVGKSAQFPLHTWLPDAMAGPTPVSALIHAATMVVAGVFLVARLYGVFWQGFHIGAGDGYTPVAMVGGVTILIAALLAFVQSDIKKVLAYSTVSQLGYMVMALGVGGWTAGVFHLFTHAFFKACLFLGAGSISHSGSHHSFDMKKDMGGLRKPMPITFWTFVIASLALAGIFPFAGFWSKDEILVSAGANGYEAFQIVGIVGAFLTAAYMTRCIYLTFFGEPRGAAAHHHPHESPPAITGPLVVLAILSVGAGFLNATMFHIEKFTEWFEPAAVTAVVTHHGFQAVTAVVGLAAAVLGFAVTYAWFWLHAPERLHGLTRRNRLAHAGEAFLLNRYYLDDVYERGVVGAISGPIARASYWVNQYVIDGIVNGVGVASRATAGVVYGVLDQKVVDGVVNGAGLISEESGSVLRYIQTGRVQQYAALLFGAVAVLALALVLAT